jgi:parallel beta-helix repeat protein
MASKKFMLVCLVLVAMGIISDMTAYASCMSSGEVDVNPLQVTLPQSHEVSALSAADLDEDGIADLVVGMTNRHQGALVVLRGNADSIYPFSPEARKRRAAGTFTGEPFLAPLQTSEISVVPELLATGDFDNDGHNDVVLAAVGDQALWLLAGDGTGRLMVPRRLPIPGRLTSLVAGDVHVQDLLVDLVVAVENEKGKAGLLVFNDPRGALLGPAESVELPAPAADLVIASLKPGKGSVLAAAGNELVLVHARSNVDRDPAESPTPFRVDRLPLPGKVVTAAMARDPERRPTVLVALEDGTLHYLPASTVAALVAGAASEKQTANAMQYRGNAGGHPIELVTARINSGQAEDLLAILDSSLALYNLGPEKEGEMEKISPEVVDSPVAVVNLRLGPSALQHLVIAQGGANQPLMVAGKQAGTTITVNDNGDGADHTVDGVCETGSGNGICTLRAAIEEANQATPPVTISFADMADGDITSFPLSALPEITNQVIIDGSTHPNGMFVVDGTLASGTGLSINAAFCTIRGLSLHSFEVGLRLYADGAIVEGCHIGVSYSADSDLGNHTGISIEATADECLIGGPATAARNVISGNDGKGIQVLGGENLIQGNYIGTDGSGTSNIRNTNGVSLTGAANIVGGTESGEGNLISGNNQDGIVLDGATGCKVMGNLIGTDISGDLVLGNGWAGVCYNAISKTAATDPKWIGGTAALAGNVISGNHEDGIRLESSRDVIVQGNKIGTNADGLVAVRNVNNGIRIRYPLGENTIGGSFSAGGNLISGNWDNGIYIYASSNGQLIRGNRIGTDANGQALGNSGHGILIESASLNIIGGSEFYQRNRIAYNSLDGINIVSGLFNRSQRNVIFGNGGLAIDLNDDGTTANDAGDMDDGANRSMNSPVISSVQVLPDGNLRVTYEVDAPPTSCEYDLQIELFAADSDGQGHTFLAADTWTVADDTAGSKTRVLINQSSMLAPSLLVATATDAAGNTSELSAPVATTILPSELFADDFESGDLSAWSASSP